MYGSPVLLRWLYPSALWHYNRMEKVLYLSFDDGPNPIVSKRILKILAQYKVKATFFCLGKHANDHPNILSEIISHGHTIGNHGFQHLDGIKTSLRKYLKNYTSSTKILSTKLFRPPYGRIRISQYRKIRKSGGKIVFWDIISNDYKKKLNCPKALRKIIQKTKNGSIIIFHDNKQALENLEFLLPQYIELFVKQGYEFKAM